MSTLTHRDGADGKVDGNIVGVDLRVAHRRVVDVRLRVYGTDCGFRPISLTPEAVSLPLSFLFLTFPLDSPHEIDTNTLDRLREQRL